MKTNNILSEQAVVSQVLAHLIRSDIYSSLHIGTNTDPFDVLTGMRKLNYQLAEFLGLMQSDLPSPEEYYQITIQINEWLQDKSLSDNDAVQNITDAIQRLIDKYVTKYIRGSSLTEMPWMGTLQ